MAARGSRGKSGNPNAVAPEHSKWKPGQSGNPSGRPKDYLTQAIRKVMTPEDAEALGTTLKQMALGGDLRAIEIIMDRVEGKAIARTEQGEPGAFDRMEMLDGMTPEDLRSLIRVAGERKQQKTA